MMRLNEICERAVRSRPGMLPVAGVGLAWLFAMAALDVKEPPRLLVNLSLVCYVVGLTLIAIESCTLTVKQLFPYFLRVMCTLNEPVVYMFIFLECLSYIGIFHPVPLQTMTAYMALTGFESLHQVAIQMVLTFFIGRTLRR